MFIFSKGLIRLFVCLFEIHYVCLLVSFFFNHSLVRSLSCPLNFCRQTYQLIARGAKKTVFLEEFANGWVGEDDRYFCHFAILPFRSFLPWNMSSGIPEEAPFCRRREKIWSWIKLPGFFLFLLPSFLVFSFMNMRRWEVASGRMRMRCDMEKWKSTGSWTTDEWCERQEKWIRNIEFTTTRHLTYDREMDTPKKW